MSAVFLPHPKWALCHHPAGTLAPLKGTPMPGDRAALLPRPPACPQACTRALHRGAAGARTSLVTDGWAWALAVLLWSAGRRAEHECPRCHHGQHRRRHGTSHLVAGTQGRPLPTRGFISRGPRTPTPSPGESDSTPGSQPHSSKPLPTASVQKLQPPASPLPAPPS